MHFTRFSCAYFAFFVVMAATNAQDTAVPEGSTVMTEQTVNSGFTFTLGGTITGSPDDGIFLTVPGRVVVLTTGIITGSANDGIDIGLNNENATVSLAGTITNSGSDGLEIDANSGSILSLNNSGFISNSGADNINVDVRQTSIFTLSNSGIITVSPSAGVELSSINDSRIIFTNNGTISNSQDNVDIDTANNGSALFINNGILSGSTQEGIEVDSTGDSTFTGINNGTITASGRDGARLDSRGNSILTFTNNGAITNSGNDAIHADARNSSRLTINNFGSINGTGVHGVNLNTRNTANLIFNNSGSILNAGSNGIRINSRNTSSIFFHNYGVVSGSGANGVRIDPQNSGQVIFNNNGSILNSGADGISSRTRNSSNAVINNNGTISGSGSDGVFLDSRGSSNQIFTNNGSILNSGSHGVNLDTRNTSSLTFINKGTISVSNNHGIRAIQRSNASSIHVINDSGRILGSGADGTGDAINLGNRNQMLTLSGFSVIEGRINGGGGGGDVLTFSNMFVTPEVLAKMRQMAAAGNDFPITIFGEYFDLRNFETIRINNVRTLDEFVTLSELNDFVEAIGNVPNLRNEDLRQFLARLGKVNSEASRNAIAANITGMNRNNYYSREAANWLNIRNRQFTHIFKNRRLGQQGFSSSGTGNLPAHMRIGQDGAASPSQDRADSLNGFFNIIGSVSRYDDRLVNGKSKSGSAILGLDTMINEHLTLGVYGGYSYSTADIDGIGSEIESHSGDLGVYGIYQNGDTFVEGSTGYRMIFYDQKREIPFLNDEAGSETEGHQFSASMRLGHDLRLASDQDFIITPQLMLSYSQLFIDDYHESGAGGMNLNVDSQTAYSLRSETGVRITKKFSGDKGWIAPSLYCAWVHEFLDGPRDVRTGFRGGNFDRFNVSTSKPDRDWFLAGFSLSGSPSSLDNVTFSLNYNTELGREDIKSHSISLDCRIKF